VFGLSNNKIENNQLAAARKEMHETKERFFVFIGKLEEKLKEFTAASIPELKELNNTDTDQFKRGYLRMKSAVLGQLDSIQKKAVDVKEEKIAGYIFPFNDHEISKLYSEFRNECYDRFLQLDELYARCRQEVEDTYSEDFELQYQKILDEYESIKDKFHCKQCGSPIAIDKLYFTTTYITCPACQTRNTFEPSSLAKMLEHIGRSLAEQRTRHLLKEHDEIPRQTQILYMQRHELELSLIHENDKTIVEQKKAQIQAIEKQQQDLESKRPALYQNYLRAMFDEWNKINPALADEHEKFYTRLLNDYQK
jgi:RNA polymerase-binding transcription factor DksA